MKKKYPSIQVLRGVLFLIILAFHCNVPYANFGWEGVQAFFVLSAFFVTRKLFDNETFSLREQFKRRIERLYPPYVVVVLLGIAFSIMARAVPWDAITHLTFTQNFQWMVTGYSSPMQPITAHTWTMSIEVWVGLLWLILLKYLNSKQFRAAMWVAIALAVTYRMVLIGIGSNVWIISLCPIAHIDAFACGSLLAISSREKRIRAGSSVSILLIGFAGIFITIWRISMLNSIALIDAYKLLSSSKNYLGDLITGNLYIWIDLFTVGIIGLLYLYDDRRTNSVSLIVKGFIYLGDNSYVLYLFHWPLLFVIRRVINIWWMQFIVTFAFTLLAMIIFNWYYARVKKSFSGGK